MSFDATLLSMLHEPFPYPTGVHLNRAAWRRESHWAFEEVAVGEAVLAGGEAAGLVAIEACVRLVPGVLGQAGSLQEESFEDGLLEHPQYTRPRAFEGLDIPEVLLGGNHAEIGKWRQ